MSGELPGGLVASGMLQFVRLDDQCVTAAAHRADRTVLKSVAPLRWTVQQVLPDPAGENTGYLEGEIDLRERTDPNLPLVRLLAIHA